MDGLSQVEVNALSGAVTMGAAAAAAAQLRALRAGVGGDAGAIACFDPVKDWKVRVHVWYVYVCVCVYVCMCVCVFVCLTQLMPEINLRPCDLCGVGIMVYTTLLSLHGNCSSWRLLK